MALRRPFVTSGFTSYAGDVRSTKVSLVVSVIDGATDEKLSSRMNVFLKEDMQSVPILNPSGYYCFIDLRPDTYTVIVQPSTLQGDAFFDGTESVDIASLDELNPVKEITLIPKASYPFPLRATLVRGLVERSADPEGEAKAVPDAEVSAGYVGQEQIMTSRTDHNGEFVLHVTDIKLENTNKKRLKDIDIRIVKGSEEASVRVNDAAEEKLTEGKTAKVRIADFPNA